MLSGALWHWSSFQSKLKPPAVVLAAARRHAGFLGEWEVAEVGCVWMRSNESKPGTGVALGVLDRSAEGFMIEG